MLDPKRTARKYSPRTLKTLFAFSGNRCAKPECTNPIIKSATEFSPDAVVGQISHIFALRDKGPRGNPNLTEKQRNEADNLILLCPTDHVVVDTQYATYPATLLADWKRRQERPYREQISSSLNELGFSELEVAARALLSIDAVPNLDLSNIPPQEKIDKNNLGATSSMLLRMGAAKSREVETVLLKATQLDPHFSDRLRNGFVARYKQFKATGLNGDDLFLSMYDWAAGSTNDKIRVSAGLCILTHLFIICDVFEK